MKKLLYALLAIVAVALLLSSLPAHAQDARDPRSLSLEQFLALDVHPEPNGATPQKSVLRWYGDHEVIDLKRDAVLRMRPVLRFHRKPPSPHLRI